LTPSIKILKRRRLDTTGNVVKNPIEFEKKMGLTGEIKAPNGWNSLPSSAKPYKGRMLGWFRAPHVLRSRFIFCASGLTMYYVWSMRRTYSSHGREGGTIDRVENFDCHLECIHSMNREECLGETYQFTSFSHFTAVDMRVRAVEDGDVAQNGHFAIQIFRESLERLHHNPQIVLFGSISIFRRLL
jgi:hypothetical protein